MNGTIHIDDQAIKTAQSDLLSGYNDAVSRSVTSESLPGNMGGLTFTPGLYTNSTSVLIQGAGPANNVTLDAQGDPNAIFIFKMGSTLTTGPGAQVILAGGAKASNVFWQVGTSATLNTTTIFKGNILASVTITVNDGSAVEGRLLAGSNSAGSVTVNGYGRYGPQRLSRPFGEVIAKPDGPEFIQGHPLLCSLPRIGKE